MRHLTCFVILASVSVLAACATQAPEASTTTASSRHDSVPATAATGAQASQTAQKDRLTIPSGYERIVKNGEEQFCRNDLITGSRAQRVRVCLTRAQLQAQQSDSQNMLLNIERQQGASTSLGTPGQGGMAGH